MPGVRIRAVDPALADSEVILPHPARRTAGGAPKRYHFRLDAQASCIVSEVVWERLLEVMAHASGAPRFVAVDHVRRPPAQIVGESAQFRPSFELVDGLLIPAGPRPQPRLAG